MAAEDARCSRTSAPTRRSPPPRHWSLGLHLRRGPSRGSRWWPARLRTTASVDPTAAAQTASAASDVLASVSSINKPLCLFSREGSVPVHL